MWMTEYIIEIKKHLRDDYGFVPVRYEGEEPVFGDLPAGVYPMTIDGKRDYVALSETGHIRCCNFDEKDLYTFWNEQAKWSRSVFGEDNIRGPAGPLKHLIKEAQECIDNPTDLEEYADLLFLVFDSTRRAGFNLDELRVAAFAKLEKNKNRQWQKPTTDEPVEHIR